MGSNYLKIGKEFFDILRRSKTPNRLLLFFNINEMKEKIIEILDFNYDLHATNFLVAEELVALFNREKIKG